MSEASSENSIFWLRCIFYDHTSWKFQFSFNVYENTCDNDCKLQVFLLELFLDVRLDFRLPSSFALLSLPNCLTFVSESFDLFPCAIWKLQSIYTANTQFYQIKENKLCLCNKENWTHFMFCIVDENVQQNFGEKH